MTAEQYYAELRRALDRRNALLWAEFVDGVPQPTEETIPTTALARASVNEVGEVL